MRHHSLCPRAWPLAPGLVWAVAACSTDLGVGGYTVTYRANVSGIATIDSALYDNGTGTLVKVTAPSPAWVVTLSVAGGGSVEVHLFGGGTAAGSANLVRLWMTATGDMGGDSVAVSTAAATPFTAGLPSRRL